MAPTVKVVEVLKVTPYPPPPSDPLSLPLTFFDTFWIKLPPIECIFLYHLPHLSPPLFQSHLLPNLIRSLSLTLRHFRPASGNLTWPSHSAAPFILYTPGDALSLTVAESTADFHHIAGDGVRKAADSLPYVPELPASTILSLQVTLFPNRGFSIAFSAHHGIVDGRSQELFMKAWAHICRNISEGTDGIERNVPVSLPESLTPVFDRSRTRIENSEGIAAEYLDNWFQFQLNRPGADPNLNPRNLDLVRSMVDTNLLRATFDFNRNRIDKIREAVALESENPNFQFSSFALALGYTLVCLVKAKGLRGDQTMQASFSADFRSRLDPPAPRNYFGNCVFAFEVVLRAAEAGCSNGVAYAAGKIVETIGELDRGVMEGAKGRLAKFLLPHSGQLAIGVAGSPRLGVYGVDFGYGRPRKVEITSTARTGAISMVESKDGSGGLEVGVVLKEGEMAVFCAAFSDGFTSLKKSCRM